jgi:hypothetical protein
VSALRQRIASGKTERKVAAMDAAWNGGSRWKGSHCATMPPGASLAATIS